MVTVPVFGVILGQPSQGCVHTTKFQGLIFTVPTTVALAQPIAKLEGIASLISKSLAYHDRSASIVNVTRSSTCPVSPLPSNTPSLDTVNVDGSVIVQETVVTGKINQGPLQRRPNQDGP